MDDTYTVILRSEPEGGYTVLVPAPAGTLLAYGLTPAQEPRTCTGGVLP